MPKTRLIWFLAVLLALTLTAPQPTTLAATPTSTGSDLLAAVNAFRATQGMPAVASNPALMAAAQRHADWIAANHRGSHVGEGGTMPQDRATAAGYLGVVLENVAEGTQGYATVAWAVEGWANSPGHRWTMLNDAEDGGAGVASDAENDYYVFLIGRRDSYFPPFPGAASTPAAAVVENPASLVPAVVPVVLAEPDENGTIYHVVQTGQTAWDIAARYGVALDDLLALNGWPRSVVLKPGDRVLVRLGSGQAAPPTPTPIAQVVAKDGQTFWEIAVTHGLTVDQLLAYNHLTRADVLHPGDVLRLVPEPAAATVTSSPTAPASTPTPSPLPPSATVPPTLAPTSTPLPPTPAPTLTATSAPPSPLPSPTPTTPAPAADESSTAMDRKVIGSVLGIVVLALVLIGIGARWWLSAARRA